MISKSDCFLFILFSRCTKDLTHPLRAGATHHSATFVLARVIASRSSRIQGPSGSLVRLATRATARRSLRPRRLDRWARAACVRIRALDRATTPVCCRRRCASATHRRSAAPRGCPGVGRARARRVCACSQPTRFEPALDLADAVADGLRICDLVLCLPLGGQLERLAFWRRLVADEGPLVGVSATIVEQRH